MMHQMMDDKEIIRLYQCRDERAAAETEAKYGALLRHIAGGILDRPEDAEECVNDALMAAWQRIPQVEPDSLKAFLVKMVRDIALSRYRAEHAAKRGAGSSLLLDELDECVPSAFSVEEQIEAGELSVLIESWLREQVPDERALFIRRYYFGESVKDLAAAYGCREQKMAQIMLRLRRSLKKTIEKWRQ